LLQETIAGMPEEEARYHIMRCIDSGLWVPEAKSKEKDAVSDAVSNAVSDAVSDEVSDAVEEKLSDTPDPE
jgi:cell division cycle protein 37